MKLKVLNTNAIIPMRAREGDAGLDLSCPQDTVVKPGRQVIFTNLAIELPYGYEATVRPRSGFSLKGMEGYLFADTNMERPLRFDADVLLGTIDENYRGNIGVIIKSNEKMPFIIKRGTRIAQLVVSVVANRIDIDVVSEISETDRGDGGFGHSGTYYIEGV